MLLAARRQDRLNLRISPAVQVYRVEQVEVFGRFVSDLTWSLRSPHSSIVLCSPRLFRRMGPFGVMSVTLLGHTLRNLLGKSLLVVESWYHSSLLASGGEIVEIIIMLIEITCPAEVSYVLSINYGLLLGLGRPLFFLGWCLLEPLQVDWRDLRWFIRLSWGLVCMCGLRAQVPHLIMGSLPLNMVRLDHYFLKSTLTISLLLDVGLWILFVQVQKVQLAHHLILRLKALFHLVELLNRSFGGTELPSDWLKSFRLVVIWGDTFLAFFLYTFDVGTFLEVIFITILVVITLGRKPFPAWAMAHVASHNRNDVFRILEPHIGHQSHVRLGQLVRWIVDVSLLSAVHLSGFDL